MQENKTTTENTDNVTKRKMKIRKILLISFLIPVLFIIWGYDKQILSSIPYRFIQKSFFQFYLSISPSDSIVSDLFAALASLILSIISLIFVFIVKTKKWQLGLFSGLYFFLILVSIFIALTRTNFYSVKIVNNYESKITNIGFDGKRKIKALKPNEKKWIIYHSNYPNIQDNMGSTWHTVFYEKQGSKMSITLMTGETMREIIIPDDDEHPGGIQYY